MYHGFLHSTFFGCQVGKRTFVSPPGYVQPWSLYALTTVLEYPIDCITGDSRVWPILQLSKHQVSRSKRWSKTIVNGHWPQSFLFDYTLVSDVYIRLPTIHVVTRQTLVSVVYICLVEQKRCGKTLASVVFIRLGTSISRRYSFANDTLRIRRWSVGSPDIQHRAQYNNV